MIGILSDTHDNMDAIRKAVELFNKEQVGLVLHAGDMVSPFTIRVFKDLSAPMIGVFGNNDGDRKTLTEFFKDTAEFSQGWTKTEYEGCRIYLTHRPLPAVPPDCDLYVYGHTHEIVLEQGPPAVINPGECSGWLSSKCTVALFDEKTRAGQIVQI